jgi:hypothetical protein
VESPNLVNEINYNKEVTMTTTIWHCISITHMTIDNTYPKEEATTLTTARILSPTIMDEGLDDLSVQENDKIIVSMPIEIIEIVRCGHDFNRPMAVLLMQFISLNIEINSQIFIRNFQIKKLELQKVSRSLITICICLYTWHQYK